MTLVFDPATMSTGDATLDAQHGEMFAQCNAMLVALEQDVNPQRALEMLDELEACTRRHFAHEEACMDAHRCPAAANNRHAHAHFLQVLQEFRSHVAAGRSNEELRRRWPPALEAWIELHIVKVDTQLKPCLARRRSVEAPA